MEAGMNALGNRLDQIERQIADLRLLLVRNPESPRVVSLKGVLRNTRVSAREIREAKRSLFPPAHVK
jgi:hypothetical protein